MRKAIPPLFTIPVFVISVLASTGTVRAQDSWLKADGDVVRVSPAAFHELPRRISRKLISLGCTIPQAKELFGLHNVIRGHFKSPGQIDWAVLCSRNQTSSILIFWRASASSWSEIVRAEDKVFLQTIESGGTIGFSRTIAAVNENYILKHYRNYHGPKPPPLNHQGIENGFVGKGSTIYYYFSRRWHELQGAD
jgi:hypothetical protein